MCDVLQCGPAKNPLRQQGYVLLNGNSSRTTFSSLGHRSAWVDLKWNVLFAFSEKQTGSNSKEILRIFTKNIYFWLKIKWQMPNYLNSLTISRRRVVSTSIFPYRCSSLAIVTCIVTLFNVSYFNFFSFYLFLDNWLCGNLRLLTITF